MNVLYNLVDENPPSFGYENFTLAQHIERHDKIGVNIELYLYFLSDAAEKECKSIGKLMTTISRYIWSLECVNWNEKFFNLLIKDLKRLDLDYFKDVWDSKHSEINFSVWDSYMAFNFAKSIFPKDIVCNLPPPEKLGTLFKRTEQLDGGKRKKSDDDMIISNIFINKSKKLKTIQISSQLEVSSNVFRKTQILDSASVDLFDKLLNFFTSFMNRSSRANDVITIDGDELDLTDEELQEIFDELDKSLFN